MFIVFNTVGLIMVTVFETLTLPTKIMMEEQELQMLLPMHNLQEDFICSLLNVPENRHTTAFPLCEFQEVWIFLFIVFIRKKYAKGNTDYDQNERYFFLSNRNHLLQSRRLLYKYFTC